MSLPKLNILKLSHWPIFKQLQLEEALLRCSTENWCLLNIGTPPAVVLGISGEVDKLINLTKWRDKPIPLIRRFSGGGTVVVDPETWFVSFICSTSATNTSSCPQKILNWSGEIYRSLFSDAFQVRENDYILGDRKFGGNAQYFRKERWLHHSSLLWSYSEELMQYLLLPPKMPAYRNKRSHSDFLVSLSKHFSSREPLEDQLLEQLSHRFELRYPMLDEALQIMNLPHRKATTELSI